MTMKQFRRVFGIVLSIALIVSGICLMHACWQVYTAGGDHPYTAQRVAKAFQPIAPPVYFALGLSVISLFLPGKPEKQKPEKNYPLMLQKLHEKNDLTCCGDQKLVAAIGKERKSRKLHAGITLALLLAGFVAVLIYSTGMDRVYSGEAHQSTEKIKATAAVMLACFAVPFGYGIFTAYFTKASIRREYELMKLVAAPRVAPLPAARERSKITAYLPYVGLLVAVLLIVVGYLGDGHMGVLAKAIEICKECVGIG